MNPSHSVLSGTLDTARLLSHSSDVFLDPPSRDISYWKGGVGKGPPGLEQSLWATRELHGLPSCPHRVTLNLIVPKLCSLGSHSSFRKPHVNSAQRPESLPLASGREPRTPVSSLIHSLSPGQVPPVALSRDQARSWGPRPHHRGGQGLDLRCPGSLSARGRRPKVPHR